MPTRNEVLAQLTSFGPFELEQDHLLGYPIRVYRNATRSTREILESTRQFPERVFMVYGDERITFGEHFGQVAALADFLLQKSVRKGDRVAVGMRNYPEWMTSFWACQVIGAVVVANNAWWTEPEFSYALEDFGAIVLIVDGERVERLAPTLRRRNLKALIVARRVALGDDGIDFFEVTQYASGELPKADILPSDYSTILYTSGTTQPRLAQKLIRSQRKHKKNRYRR